MATYRQSAGMPRDENSIVIMRAIAKCAIGSNSISYPPFARFYRKFGAESEIDFKDNN